MKSEKGHPLDPEIRKKARHKLVTLIGVSALLVLTIVVCVSLWRVEWLRPWLASCGAALVAFIGPVPGLVNPETRGKWLTLVAVSSLVGIGTWYATKYLEDKRREAENDVLFSELLLRRVPSDVADKLCLSVACPLRQSLHEHGPDYGRIERATRILRSLRPANGHALYFAGEAYLGLRDYGQMLTAFKSYLYNGDKNPAEAYDGDSNKCYSRSTGYCAERTAWIEHRLANYFLERARELRGSEKIAALQQAVTDAGYMVKARKIGFNADLTTHDTEDLLRQTADQLKSMNQDSSRAEMLLSQVEEERRKAAAEPPKPEQGEPCTNL